MRREARQDARLKASATRHSINSANSPGGSTARSRTEWLRSRIIVNVLAPVGAPGPRARENSDIDGSWVLLGPAVKTSALVSSH